MTPQEFVAKWMRVELSERSACQQHFLDLCDLLGQPKPAAADPDGAFYTFEKGVRKTDGGSGWADVWMRDHFGWEYKKRRRDLKSAYNQLLQYREDLENPPLLIVCDLDRFEIHTNFTGTVKKVYEFALEKLADRENLETLRKVFTDPQSLKPGQTPAGLTKQVSELVGQIADGMRLRGMAPLEAAHFLMKLIFCMFAEDIALLPNKVFSRAIAAAKKSPSRLDDVLKDLFRAMASGGLFGADEILWFNGGLFKDTDVHPLAAREVDILNMICQFDWSDIEPSIFGTLFERTLDPAKRSQIGAHYTSRDDILTLLEPVMMAPLRREWMEVKEKCNGLYAKIRESGPKKTVRTKDSKPRRDFDKLIRVFVERLAHVTVLDPACGSGNFLYVAINLLLDLEKEVITYASTHGVTQLPQVRPTQLAGIEINPYAQQLAQVVIWIGYLQWMHHNGFNPPSSPVLEPIESIRLMDAILDLSDPEHPSEPEWPAAEFIVGNPPFLGDKRLRSELGDSYVESLFGLYGGRLPNQIDICCYWFEKARDAIARNCSRRAGLLATQGIRGGMNRRIVKRIKETGDIFFACSDREWILEGATVHISMIGFDKGQEKTRLLNGQTVAEIHSNLTSTIDVTLARSLSQNKGVSFQGPVKVGSFEVSDIEAFHLLVQPTVSKRPVSDVVRPWLNGIGINGREPPMWIIDFREMPQEEAAKYEGPFEHVRIHVKPTRDIVNRDRRRRLWWIHGEVNNSFRGVVCKLSRYLATCQTGKHRFFIWVDPLVLPAQTVIAFALPDDLSFGLLHSRIHETWARSQGTQLRERESGFRYTPTTCFETFPFPKVTKSQAASISTAARELDALRNNWLNPSEWTREEVLDFPGSVDGPWARYVHDPDARGVGTVRYPRTVPKNDECAKELKKRTLTNLYNQKPTWLQLAHKKLDEAVFAAYGWDSDLTDEQILEKLLALNLGKSAESRDAPHVVGKSDA